MTATTPAKKRGKRNDDGPNASEKPQAKDNGSSNSTAGDNLVAVDGSPVGIKVLTACETEAMQAHEKVLDLHSKAEGIHLALAALLYLISSKRLYTQIGPGYNTFREYVDSELLDVYRLRTVHYLTNIWFHFAVVHGGHPQLLERVEKIGWSKAKELVGLVTPDNADEWFKIAETKTTKELVIARRAALKAATGKGYHRLLTEFPEPEPEPETSTIDVSGVEVTETNEGADGEEKTTSSVENLISEIVAEAKAAIKAKLKPMRQRKVDGVINKDGVAPPTAEQLEMEAVESKKWKRLTFDLPPDHEKIVKKALDIAEEVSDGHAKHGGSKISLICLNFCSGYHERPIAVGEWMKAIEDTTGLTIIAIDETNNKIMYGEESAERLSATKEKIDGDQ